MKTSIKKGKIINEADIDGPMMIHNPMTKKQEKKLGEWVADRKNKRKASEPKRGLQKTIAD